MNRALFLLALAGGCAAQHEEASRAESPPASERDYEDAVDQEPEAVAPATEEEQPVASLEQLQLELATNNAKLRELGVELPVELPVEEQDAEIKAEELGAGGRAATGTTWVAPAPAGKPPVPGGVKPKPSKSDRGEEKKQQRDKDKAGGAKPKDEPTNDLRDDVVRPEAAKSAPPMSGQLDAAARCQQVCDLAAISCGLGDQICELADRHPDEPPYVAACERANADCEAAKEACDACAE